MRYASCQKEPKYKTAGSYCLVIKLTSDVKDLQSLPKILGTPNTFAIKLQYIHRDGTASNRALECGQLPSPQTMLGFKDKALLHHKTNELEEIPLLHHSYTTLFGGRGGERQRNVRESVKRSNYFGNDCRFSTTR